MAKYFIQIQNIDNEKNIGFTIEDDSVDLIAKAIGVAIKEIGDGL